MCAFKNGQESTQKITNVKYTRVGEGTKGDRISITYNRVDGNNPTQEMTTAKLTASFTEDEKKLLKESVETKGELTITKVFDQKEGSDKGYWNLKEIKPADSFVPKVSNSFKNNKTSKPAFDSSGAKAGGVLHDAVAVSIAQKGKDVTVADISDIARKLLKLSTELEDEVRSGISTVSNSDKQEVMSKPATSKVTDNFDSLDDLDSLEIEL